MLLCAACVCVCTCMECAISFYLYLWEKDTEIAGAGVGGWEFSLPTVNANVLNKDSELISKCVHLCF